MLIRQQNLDMLVNPRDVHTVSYNLKVLLPCIILSDPQNKAVAEYYHISL